MSHRVQRDKKPVRIVKRFYKQDPLNSFNEVLYLFRKDDTNTIKALAFDPGDDIKGFTKEYNYTTDLNYAMKVMRGKRGRGKSEFRVQFVSPEYSHISFPDTVPNMDRIIFYHPESKERKAVQTVKEFCKTHDVKYDKSTVKEMISCGADSYGELLINRYLKKNGVKFTTQNDGKLACYSPVTGVRLPYDFEISKTRTVIELQGRQHYKKSKVMNNTDSKMSSQKFRDDYKRKFAGNNGYNEVEISYKDVENGKYLNILDELIKSYKSK